MADVNEAGHHSHSEVKLYARLSKGLLKYLPFPSKLQSLHIFGRIYTLKLPPLAENYSQAMCNRLQVVLSSTSAAHSKQRLSQ